MSSIAKRVLFSFLFSVAGLGATYYFFKVYYPVRKIHINEKPIAEVEKLENISRKKLAQHRTWQIIEFGESLYSGETIKTSSDSDLQIRFLDSNAILNLEADSLITIQRNKNDISLNLLEGNIFVDSTNNETDLALKLETLDGSVDLSKASANLSKDQGAALDVNVLSGRASIVDRNGQKQDLSSEKFKFMIVEPKPLVVLEAKESQVKVKWIGERSIQLKDLVFKIGSKRTDLVAVKPISLNETEAILPAKFGKNFVQIELNGASKQQTSVRFELKALVDPIKVEAKLTPAEPQPELLWLNEKEETQTYVLQPAVELKWNVKNTKNVKELILKIFDGDQVILTEKLLSHETTFKAALSKPGRYLASLEAVDEDNKNLTQSKLKAIVSSELPHISEPGWDQTQTVHRAQLNGSYETKWDTSETVKEYKLVLKNKDGKVIKEWTQKKNFLKLNGMLPGDYTLTLATIDTYDRLSPNTVTKTISVPDVSEIEAPKLKKLRFK